MMEEAVERSGVPGIGAFPCPKCGELVSVDEASSCQLRQCSHCSWWASTPSVPGSATFTLEVVGGPHPKGSFELAAHTVLGRGTEAGFRIADPDVSRRHARLFIEKGQLQIEDLSSRNGTFVAGMRIGRVAVPLGAEIRLGPSTLVRLSRPAEGPAGPVASGLDPWANGVDGAVRASCTAEMAGLLSDAQGAPERLAKTHKKLQLVYSAVEALSTILEPDELVERILDLLFGVVPADRGAVLLFDTRNHCLQTRAVRSRTGQATETLVISSTIVGRVLNERLGLLVEDTSRDRALDVGKSIVAQDIRSALAAPILYREKLFGALYLDAVGRVAAFDRDDLDAGMALARQAAIRLENAELVRQVSDEAVARADLQRYLPAHLVSRVFNKEIELKPGGVRADVTVLFTDLRDFTRHSSSMQPEQVIEMLNAYFEEMVDVVFKYGGTLDKYIGDALMAVWGSPLPCDDGPMQAVRCALEMQARVGAFNQLNEGKGWPALAMGVGINAGPALVGNLGASRRMEFTVLGHTVNMASRLESLNKELASKILISNEVWTRLGGRVLAQPRQVRVKGVEEPVTVHSVEGLYVAEGGPQRERRRSPRIQVAVDAEAYLTIGSRRLDGIVISASRTGAGVLLAVEDAGWLQAGQQVELSFRHEAAGPVTRVQGTVVRIAPPEDPAKPVFQVGIDFTAEYAPDPGS